MSSKQTLVCAVVILVVSAVSPTVYAQIIDVPDDYSTIQEALTAASEDDTVMVEPGTYLENIVWPQTNSIKLLSEGDSSNTVIDGGGNGSVLRIHTSEQSIDSTTVISGFTLRNGGNTERGGGLFVDNDSPTLRDLLIMGSKAEEEGGGVWVRGASTFENVVVRSNEASSGGGMKLASNPVLRGVVIEHNRSDKGGGLTVGDGTPEITHALVRRNVSTVGGGVYAAGSIELVNLTVVENRATDTGGGAYFCCTASLGNSTIARNTAAAAGGGLYVDGAGDLEAVTIINNNAPQGAGLFDSGENTEISYSNLVMNGSAVYDANDNNSLSAANNWWGDSSGPYHPQQNPAGEGDSTNASVDVTPFLTEPDNAAPPIPIQDLDLVNQSGDSVTIEWSASPHGDAAGYKVYYDSDSTGFAYEHVEDAGMDTSYTLTELEENQTYYISVTVYDEAENESWHSKELRIQNGQVLFTRPDQVPSQYSLSQNYPNPFNPTTRIRYSLPEAATVDLTIFDALGRKVDTVVHGERSAGEHVIRWDAGGLPTGTYYYRLNTGHYIETKSMTLVK